MADKNELGIQLNYDAFRYGWVFGDPSLDPSLQEFVSSEAKGPGLGVTLDYIRWLGENGWIGLGGGLDFPIYRLFQLDGASTPEGDTNVVMREKAAAIGDILGGGSMGFNFRLGRGAGRFVISTGGFIDASQFEYVSGGKDEDKGEVPVQPGRGCDKAAGCTQRTTTRVGPDLGAVWSPQIPSDTNESTVGIDFGLRYRPSWLWQGLSKGGHTFTLGEETYADPLGSGVKEDGTFGQTFKDLAVIFGGTLYF